VVKVSKEFYLSERGLNGLSEGNVFRTKKLDGDISITVS
jgi:hypothetical protein